MTNTARPSVAVDRYSAMVRQAKIVQKLVAKLARAEHDLEAAQDELEKMRVAAGLPASEEG